MGDPSAVRWLRSVDMEERRHERRKINNEPTRARRGGARLRRIETLRPFEIQYIRCETETHLPDKPSQREPNMRRIIPGRAAFEKPRSPDSAGTLH